MNIKTTIFYLFLFLQILTIYSATVTWSYDFGGSGADTTRNWNDASNWDTNTVPVAGDDVIILIPQIEDYVINYAETVSLNSFSLDAATVDFTGLNNAEMSVTNEFLWKAGTLTGTLKVNGGIACTFGQNFQGRTLSGSAAFFNVSVDSDMSDCEINLDDSSHFTVDTGVTITTVSDVMQFDSDDLVNPGTFINNGRIELTPLNPVGGPTWWLDVSFINQGVIECIYSSQYGHCMEVRNYEGSTQVSESSGTFIVNSKDVDYLGDFDTWPPVLLSGNFVFKEGHNFTGAGVVKLWGDAVSCSDIKDASCQRILEQTFTTPLHFTQANFEDYIRVILDADLTVDRAYWSGGVITGAGNLISNEKLTISYQGLTTAEVDIDGTSIIIKDTLDFIQGSIRGTNGAKIVVEDGATFNLHAGSYVGDDRDLGEWDFTVENNGVFSIQFDDYRGAETGRSIIVNNGIMRFANLVDEYAKSDARPIFWVEDGGQIHFGSSGTLELRIRAEPPSNDPELYEYTDTINFYEGAGCVLGGELKIEFVNVNPSAGDTFKIIEHRKEEKDGFKPCVNDFDTVTAVGLGSGLKLGLKFDSIDPDVSSRAYIEVIVCEASASSCGAKNPNQSGENGTNDTTDNGVQMEVVMLFSILFGLLI